MSWFSKKFKSLIKNDPLGKVHVKALNKAGLGSGNAIRRAIDPTSVMSEKVQEGAPITARTVFDPGNELQDDPNVQKRADLAAAAAYRAGFGNSANVLIPGVTGPTTPMPGLLGAPQIQPGGMTPAGPYGQQALMLSGLLARQPPRAQMGGLLGAPKQSPMSPMYGVAPKMQPRMMYGIK